MTDSGTGDPGFTRHLWREPAGGVMNSTERLHRFRTGLFLLSTSESVIALQSLALQPH